MLGIEERLQKKLQERKKNGNYREFLSSQAEIDFSSNDYLGLARSPILAGMIDQAYAAQSRANGATGSRLLSGNSTLAMDLEKDLAVRFKTEQALLFNSGYTANLALLSTIPQRGDTILYDELSHACIKEGARLGLAKYFSFKHNCLDVLGAKLKKSQGEKFVVVESLYSMEGDGSALLDTLELCQAHGAHLIVDEAHTTGWRGKQGGGLVVDMGLQDQILARVHTFGKAVGIHGACISGPAWLVNYMINFGRPFIFTTALPEHSLISIRCAFEFIDQHPALQQDLARNIRFYGDCTLKLGMDTGCFNRDSPIQTHILGDGPELGIKAKQLQNSGLDVRPIRSPTVKAGTGRLRICLHAFNTSQEIKKLIDHLHCPL